MDGKDDMGVVEELLERCASVNATDDCGRTPLHMAAGVGNRKVGEEPHHQPRSRE